MATKTATMDVSNRYGGLTVVPASQAVGAEIKNIDLANLDDAATQSIRNALIDYQVLLFRGQNISDAELVAFSARFGDLDLAPPQEHGQQTASGLPEIMLISNVKENGVPIGSLGDGEAIWHSDMNYVENPPLGSALYAREVPPSGGGYLRAGFDEVKDVSEGPGAIHPIIQTHPESGREVLYLGRRLNAYIVGMSVAESEVLLDEVWQYATLKEHTWHHQWRVGDIVMWDNRTVMHRRDAFDASARRVMHRTQIGNRPPIKRAV
ncbi:MAG: TauD/TfdA family dioxygenase [Rickettsiales bacterium]